MWARHSSRSLSPGTTTVPSGTARGQSRSSAAGCTPAPCPQRTQRPLSAPPALLSLTGLLELLLVVMQGLVVMHADPAHLDPQLLRYWLLAEGRGSKRGLGKGPARAPNQVSPPSCPGAQGLVAPFPAGETKAQRGAESGLGPRARGGCRGTYSLCRGVALRRLTFCTMVAWLRRAM